MWEFVEFGILGRGGFCSIRTLVPFCSMRRSATVSQSDITRPNIQFVLPSSLHIFTLCLFFSEGSGNLPSPPPPPPLLRFLSSSFHHCWSTLSICLSAFSIISHFLSCILSPGTHSSTLYRKPLSIFARSIASLLLSSHSLPSCSAFPHFLTNHLLSLPPPLHLSAFSLCI
ncbi:Hypothetical predicted protein [Xyrichtys novacula]|uniref:Uncharacterized protein n=1 Tax=Xyrichtys novacula TaxID=13765 RepID=A0AAV1HKV7_XYRNO|nr:Hypothetical predicted protein [Xyrichtys novacula]